MNRPGSLVKKKGSKSKHGICGRGIQEKHGSSEEGTCKGDVIISTQGMPGAEFSRFGFSENFAGSVKCSKGESWGDGELSRYSSGKSTLGKAH